MKVLSHACCGPCFTVTHEWLTGLGCAPDVYYFNPNIHPRGEFRRRFAYLASFCRDEGVPMIHGDYDIAAYFSSLGGELVGPERCRRCYTLRLEATARAAGAGGYDSFTTSLLVSPYQDHDALSAIGEAQARAHGVEFLYKDLRGRYRRSIELSKERDMYRQKYCGCVFSENESARDRVAP